MCVYMCVFVHINCAILYISCFLIFFFLIPAGVSTLEFLLIKIFSCVSNRVKILQLGKLGMNQMNAHWNEKKIESVQKKNSRLSCKVVSCTSYQFVSV